MVAKLSHVRPEHLFMLIRGVIWQITHLRFEGLLLLGRGARLRVDRRVRMKGLIKIGHHTLIDLTNTATGQIGPRFSLGDFGIFRASGAPDFTCPRVEVAENVSFGPYCNIGGGFGISISENVIAGPYVSLHPESHGLATDRAIREQPVHGRGIQIGSDCWLSAKVTLLDGTDLASGTVVGAGAVVTGTKTNKNGIYVGVPARFVGFRNESRDTAGLNS